MYTNLRLGMPLTLWTKHNSDMYVDAVTAVYKHAWKVIFFASKLYQTLQTTNSTKRLAFDRTLKKKYHIQSKKTIKTIKTRKQW